MAPISGGYGSLYRRASLKHSQGQGLFVGGKRDADFVEGPRFSRNFWSIDRSSTDVDHGPWDNPLSYVLAIATCER
ncbi:hypothetical protein GLOTRDRAFT_133060 [Gloeophyllum trabeum ATCC 11539]|uniref:Uncharacterized protein n=1 Tax=Gloeophyllum trabeum (strain ATCC 11539 / FP-39264 / Madison 617) TaxID=670483 RepID=S7PTR1_GLOTA|nr:uncharacterized protein GLOTRDRAFT_133060 [Gloeophyllum trabeum ATCC 11539]EPQ51181.1 hypothetical protein GLOTRDRAFT_133060 [Gloeophyllum trabeum ATCC 11539]